MFLFCHDENNPIANAHDKVLSSDLAQRRKQLKTALRALEDAHEERASAAVVAQLEANVKSAKADVRQVNRCKEKTRN